MKKAILIFIIIIGVILSGCNSENPLNNNSKNNFEIIQIKNPNNEIVENNEKIKLLKILENKT